MQLQITRNLAERVVANQIQCHMIKNNLFPQLQSAYRSHHSTETAQPRSQGPLLLGPSGDCIVKSKKRFAHEYEQGACITLGVIRLECRL